MKTFTLYGLRKPGEEVRYIGITSESLASRLRKHYGNQTEDHRGYWIAKAKGENVSIEIIPYCVNLTKEDAGKLEASMVSDLRSLGLDLVNTSPGGFLPPPKTPEQLARQSDRSLGNKYALGFTMPSEQRAKHVERMLGKKYALGSKRSPEQNASRAASMFGNKFCLGHKLTPEHKANISKGTLGVKKSPETRVRMSAANVLRWEKKRQESYLAEMWGGESNLFGGGGD